jgi:hypothetical protein
MVLPSAWGYNRGLTTSHHIELATYDMLEGAKREIKHSKQNHLFSTVWRTENFDTGVQKY